MFVANKVTELQILQVLDSILDKKLPNIFEYINYREYLEDYYQMRKIWDDGFTHSYICYKIGQKNSRTFYNNIVKGRRDLSNSFINRFSELLELTTQETFYFRILVLYCQSKDAQEKELLFEQLVQLNNTPEHRLEEESFEYYSHWYYSSVRALLDIYDFKSNYKQLSETLIPSITVEEAKRAIKLLKKLKLIEKNSNGYYKPTQNGITSGFKKNHHQVKKYQLQCLELAKLAVMDDDESAYKSSTFTVSISEKGYERIVERTTQYREEIDEIVNKDEDEDDRLYQINIQFIAQNRDKD